jgi:hypothetical protein
VRRPYSVWHTTFADALNSTDKSLTVPPEIWHKIFKNACVDGGQTGCALSLVSRRIRDASSRTRLRSISVIGLERLKALLHVLENTPEDNRRIQFLFIAARPLDPDVVERRTLQHICRFHETEIDMLIGLAGLSDQTLDDWQTVYPAVATLVAPHIEVLTLHVSRTLLDTPLPPDVHFPVLRDLTFGQVNVLDNLSLLPLLHRLHIVGNLNNEPTLFPVILHTRGVKCVRLSGGHHNEEALVSLLDEYTANQPWVVPNTLQKIIIIEPGIPTLRCGTGAYYWQRGVDLLKDFAQRSLPGETRLSIEVLAPRRDAYDMDSAARDWKDVVEFGGDGAWGSEPPP